MIRLLTTVHRVRCQVGSQESSPGQDVGGVQKGAVITSIIGVSIANQAHVS